jgi:uncharacterized protein
MRYIIVTLALALIVFWLVRAVRGRGSDEQLPKRDAGPDRQPPIQMQEMVSCAQCGLHLPKAESVAGKRAVYCSLEHQRQAEH